MNPTSYDMMKSTIEAIGNSNRDVPERKLARATMESVSRCEDLHGSRPIRVCLANILLG